jgi:hypothetical protein
MKYATVEDVMEIFPHPVLLTVQGEPDYQTIHATRKCLQANSRALDTHLDGGTLGHLGLIISDAAYAMIAPTTEAGPTLWATPQAPGRAPANTDGTAAKVSAARHIWEEDVQTYRTCTYVQQAFKKQIISVFEPMYLDILNDNMVGAPTSQQEICWITSSRLTATSLRSTSRSTLNTCAGLGILNSRLSPCSSRFKIVPTILKQGGVLVGHPQQINVGYEKIFAAGHLMSACRRWN